MGRAQEKGVVFKEDKLQFKCKEVSFFSLSWSSQGIKSDNKKVSVVQDMPPPNDVKNHRRVFLGSVRNLTRYSGCLATLPSPPRDLTKQEVVHSCSVQSVQFYT